MTTHPQTLHPAPAHTLRTPTGREVGLTFVLSFGLPIAVIVVALLATNRWAPDQMGAVTSASLAIGVVGLVIGVWWVLVHRNGWTWRDLGFVRPRRSLAHLLWQAPLIWAGSLTIAGVLRTFVPTEDPGDPSAVGRLNLDLSWPLLFGAFLVIVILAPAAEEILFRRLMLDWLNARAPVVVAVLITSALFAAIHILPAAMMYIFPLAVGLALLRLWYASLWAPVVMHMLNNGIVFAIGVMAMKF